MRNEKQLENLEGGAGWEECLSDDVLLSYWEGSLSENGATAVQRHLNSCNTCFQITVSLVKNSYFPYNDVEETEVEKLITMTPDEQVARIVSYLDEPPSPPPPPWNKRIRTVIAKLMRSADHFQSRLWPLAISRQLGFVFIVVLALSGGAFWGIRFCKTTLKIMIAERIMKDNYHIYMAETPRLSGGYASTGIQVLMDAERAGQASAYLEEARSRIAAASASGAKAA